jgi:predicted alpha-1,2-mannosidase
MIRRAMSILRRFLFKIRRFFFGIKQISFIISLLLMFSCSENEKSNLAYIDFVNPFVGTDGPGNTYPGAQYPFGAVQLSPDHGLSGWDRISGYSYSDTIISGFSHLHLSGTGAGDLYDLLFMPINNRSSRTIPENGNRPFSTFSHHRESAKPGFYYVHLDDFGIDVELTASQRGGVQRYSFPKDEGKAIFLDLGYALNWDAPVDTKIEVIDNKTIVGYRKSTGWAKDQRVYFKSVFSQEFDVVDLFISNEKSDSTAVEGKNTKAVFHFNGEGKSKIEVKTALSFSNIKGAEANFDRELKGVDFDRVKSRTQEEWNKQLSKIEVKSNDSIFLKTFYTNLYQSMLNPRIYSDVNGFYKGANGQITQAQGHDRYDLFSLWDTFRAAHPLYSIMHENRSKDMVQSMLSHFIESGLLPVWSFQGNETNMMMGYHAVPVIVDYYLKGLTKGINSEELYNACKRSALNDSIYQVYKFMPTDEKHENWSVSKTLEYSFDDWCIAQFAKDLGKIQDYEFFMERSNYWRAHFDEESKFFRPLDIDGNFLENFNAKDYTDDYCESNAWQYFWFVPQNINGLINKMGSKLNFEQRLDSMFSYYPSPDDKLPIFSTGMIGQYAHGNEPSHHVAYLYNYIGKPYKTQKMIAQICETQYSDQPSGHCGNEDCGQMSSWYVFSTLGFYPVNPSIGEYVIGSPKVDGAKLNLENGEVFEIRVKREKPEDLYIKSVKLNGEILTKSFITHKEILKGGILEFTMSDKPNEKLWSKENSFPSSSEELIAESQNIK